MKKGDIVIIEVYRKFDGNFSYTLKCIKKEAVEWCYTSYKVSQEKQSQALACAKRFCKQRRFTFKETSNEN